MAALLTLIAAVSGIGWLICFILVLIQMFQNGKTGLGVACIVLAFLCGLGGLIAFVVGWINATNWRIQNVMLAWTGCIAVGILAQILSLAFGAGPRLGM